VCKKDPGQRRVIGDSKNDGRRDLLPSGDHEDFSSRECRAEGAKEMMEIGL